MTREPIPTYFFVLMVVRKDDKFLLVHERKHGQLWYLPAGRVEPGETLIDAAIRETREEAGIQIIVDGLLRIEHTPVISYTRTRFIFTASPAEDTPPKSTPDDDTLEARWVTLEDMKNLPLRGLEVLQIFKYVADGGKVYPLDLVTYEGAPYG